MTRRTTKGGSPGHREALGLQMEVANLSAVRPHPLNPRRGDLEALVESVQVNGLYGFVGAQRSTGHILYGNHTWQAAKRLGHKTIRVCWLDVADDKAEEILAADNRMSDLGAYDEKRLVETLGQLLESAKTLAGTAYSADDYRKLVRRALDNGNKQASAKDGPPPQDADAKGPAQCLLEIVCLDERAQRRLLARLEKTGLTVRAAST